MVEIKKHIIDRKWGGIKVYDVYSDKVHVARVEGGIFDCVSHSSEHSSVTYDRDGDVSYYDPVTVHNECVEFRMTPQIMELCEKKEPCLLWEVYDVYSQKVKGCYPTSEEAYLHKERFDKVREKTSTI